MSSIPCEIKENNGYHEPLEYQCLSLYSGINMLCSAKGSDRFVGLRCSFLFLHFVAIVYIMDIQAPNVLGLIIQV